MTVTNICVRVDGVKHIGEIDYVAGKWMLTKVKQGSKSVIEHFLSAADRRSYRTGESLPKHGTVATYSATDDFTFPGEEA